MVRRRSVSAVLGRPVLVEQVLPVVAIPHVGIGVVVICVVVIGVVGIGVVRIGVVRTVQVRIVVRGVVVGVAEDGVLQVRAHPCSFRRRAWRALRPWLTSSPAGRPEELSRSSAPCRISTAAA